MARKQPQEQRIAIREAAEADLLTFIRLIAPHRVLGAIHEEVCAWWTRPDAKDNQLLLLPRDHQKSALIAYRVAWWITKHPEVTILYVSATADLAEKQLKFIQDILTNDAYLYYWPEMVNRDVNRRERWTAEEICVDHPARKKESVRDPTVKAVGLTANTTGLHCGVAVLDDLVVPGNAYTQLGRDQVKKFYSQLSSIETTGAYEWSVGTRYHPDDLYKELIDMVEYYYDEATDTDIEQPVYEVFERQVETNGEFLWPKQRRHDGRTFGFDERELARKKAKYLDTSQFYAQYYNNPNSVENSYITKDQFQYYDRDRLTRINGDWYLGDKVLNIFASMDFAYSVNSRSDWTAIVVVGADRDGFIYVLDIARFRTNRISDMYDKALKLYEKWKYKRLRCEATAAQALVVQQFKDYARAHNQPLSVDSHKPTKNKEERIRSTLEPRYSNGQIFHYKGGNCQVLEEELVQNQAEHDDVKDALACVMEIVHLPARRRERTQDSNVVYSGRFGGVAYRHG